MNLTLEVISANGSSLGAARRKVFGADGGSIGRAPDCDWVLPSPGKYVSRHHASIIFKYGQFFVQAEGQNAVGINDPNALLTCETPSPLKQGDRLFIDEYEILANVPNEAVRPPLIVGDPFADDSAPDSLLPIADSLENENLDPLSHLGTGRTAGNERGYRGPPPGDVLSDPFVPPPAVARPRVPTPPAPRAAAQPPTRTDPAPLASSALGGSGIPTDPDAWNKTTYGVGSPPKPAEPAPPRPQMKPVAPPVNTVPRETPRPVPKPSPRPSTPAVSTPAPPPRPLNPPLRSSPNQPVASPPPQPPPARRAPVPTAAGPAPAPAIAPAPGAARFDIDAMLAAAGVDPQNVTPEMAATLGQILMVVVQGTIDALRARDEVKSQFRLAVTRVRASDNNPLTFAVDAADAMNSLLSRRNSAFLPPLEAFQRAFEDIRGHQMAMLAGMRAGFENLLGRFDPQELQEGFDKQAKHSGLLGAIGKPKYWDQYADYFAALRGDRDDAFRRLFGEEFALAYEKQIELIKRSRGNKKP